MVIISTIIIIASLFIFQINPITLMRDSFFIEKSQASISNQDGQVMGVVEQVEDNKVEEQIQPLEVNPLPTNERKEVIRPIKKEDALDVEDISAESALVLDVGSGAVLYEKNIAQPLSIASITKLMTAIVALDHQPNLDEEYIIKSDDRREGGRIFLYQGDKVTVKDLLYISLVGSANTATMALVHSLDLEEKDFVEEMNKKVKEMELENTQFVDPIGLSSFNISTASELAKIVQTALENSEIQEAVSLQKYILTTGQGKQRIVENTDDLLKQKNGFKVLGGKTGFLASAGFCFAGKFSNDGSREVVSVILGSDSNEARFEETEKLVSWIFESYIWP